MGMRVVAPQAEGTRHVRREGLDARRLEVQAAVRASKACAALVQAPVEPPRVLQHCLEEGPGFARQGIFQRGEAPAL